MDEGERIKESAQKRHEEEVERLNAELKKLSEDLAIAKKSNTEDETKLNEKYV